MAIALRIIGRLLHGERRGDSIVTIEPKITPQQMRLESAVGALFSGRRRYAGPTAGEAHVHITRQADREAGA